jgi:hypothetical protein
VADPPEREVGSGTFEKEGVKKDDIRFYISRDASTKKDTLRTSKTVLPTTTKKETKMEMLRRKMMECRKKKETQETKNITVIRAATQKTWKGQKLKDARSSSRQEIQEKLIPVIVGADVQALYPSLSDLDTALICYQAVMNTEVVFQNINYHIAAKYIAICLTDTEQRLSPLYSVLPRRTAKNGVKPGVTSKPEDDKNWFFPTDVFTGAQERAIIATMVQIGVITMMNTHLYEFNGKIYLQQAGGPIGLRATCAVARVVMNHWDAEWMNTMDENNVERDLEDRYMDDIRVVMMCLKAGWR